MRYSCRLLILLIATVAVVPAIESSTGQNDNVAYPSDLIAKFPDVKWGMSYQNAKAAITKTGASPGGFSNTELAWDGSFNGVQGRATVLLKDDKVNQISVLLYAGAKRAEIYNDLLRQATAKYGKVSQEVKSSDSMSDLWKPSSDITFELRNVTDPDSPVVVIQWVHR
jgi:hypothetical protein